MQNSRIHLIIEGGDTVPAALLEDVMREFTCRAIAVTYKVPSTAGTTCTDGFSFLRNIHVNPHIAEKRVVVDVTNEYPNCMSQIQQCPGYAEMITEIHHFCDINKYIQDEDYLPNPAFQSAAASFSNLMVIEWRDRVPCLWLPTLTKPAKVHVNTIEDAEALLTCPSIVLISILIDELTYGELIE